MIKANPRILIIAENVSLLDRACLFLVRRGWQAKCVGDLRSGLDFVEKEKPTHVLISVNLPLLPVSKFPRLSEDLKNKYGTVLVAFGENENIGTMKSLTTCGLKYFVFPPVTGALLHIKLKKVLMLEDEDHLGPSKESHLITDRKNSFDEPVDLKSFAEAVNGPQAKPSRSKYLPAKIEKNRRIRKSKDTRLNTSEIRSKKSPSNFELISEPCFRGQCIGFDEPKVETIDEIEEVGVMTISSETMTGYVVLARGSKDETEMKRLLRNFGEDLMSRLKKRGLTLTNIHFMSLKVNRVKFEKWTRECAQFCFVSEHMGSETAVAFIPHGDNQPVIEISKEHPGNLIIRLEDLIADSLINFDVHLYLEKNARTFVYVKKGSYFTSERIEKVREAKSQLFIENSHESDFKSYHASIRLNQSIQGLTV